MNVHDFEERLLVLQRILLYTIQPVYYMSNTEFHVTQA